MYKHNPSTVLLYVSMDGMEFYRWMKIWDYVIRLRFYFFN